MQQQSINLGQKGMTLERRINLMLENGFNVFVLRWKKIHEYRTSYFGFEILGFVQRASRNALEMSYVPVVEKDELFFDPDELKVPVAYCADTPYNRKMLATMFYIAHFTINGLITPNGTKSRDVVNAEIAGLALELGIKPPVRSKMVGVYGNSIPVSANLNTIPQTKDALNKQPDAPDAKKSVFGSEEKLKEVIPDKAPEEKKPKLTVEECLAEGELSAITRFKPLVDKLMKEKKKYWKGSQYYKDIISPEIKKETARLLLENGHPLEEPKSSVPESADAPDAPEAPETAQDKKEPVAA